MKNLTKIKINKWLRHMEVWWDQVNWADQANYTNQAGKLDRLGREILFGKNLKRC